MQPLATFTAKAVIVAGVVIASMSIFGPQMARVIAAAWYDGEAAFLAASFQKVAPNMTAEKAEIGALAKMLR